MISTAQRWDRIVKELQKATQSKFPKTGVMCKDKWNSLNFDFKKLSYYHKGTSNHTYFWEFLFADKERFHLPCQLNKKYYEAIEAFMGRRQAPLLYIPGMEMMKETKPATH
jgi:hypothetical protein